MDVSVLAFLVKPQENPRVSWTAEQKTVETTAK
jgi:hypothetical protein